MDFTRIVALIMSFFTMIMSLTSIFSPESGVFAETVTREQTVFDEGKLDIKSFDIIVSPNGDDKNSGTADSPLKTPEAAKEKAKSLINADCGHVTVWFREGVYYLKDTLKFTQDDLSDVTYRSYPGEEVAFSGSKEISGWNETVVNGVKAFVTDCAVETEADYFNAMYNGSIRLSRPVYPKVGEFAVTAVNDADAFSPESDYFKHHAAFYGDAKNVSAFKNLSDVDVRILHFWKDDLLPLSSVNTETGRVETAKLASMTIGIGDRYFYENVFEALSEPGEWYLGRTEQKLYYIPFENETPESTVLNAGIVEKLVTVDGCADVEFRGIDFCDSAWNMLNGESTLPTTGNPLFDNIKFNTDSPQASYDAPCAVTVKNGSGVSFVDCGFERIGASALSFGLGTSDCTASSCMFNNIGGNAVFIEGVNDSSSPLVTHDITVTDCHIKTYGRIFNNAVGVLIVNAYNCEISQNEIHDGFYTAISNGWVWGYWYNINDNNRITNNLIYDIGQGWLSDMGGIYSLGVQPHTVISDNVIYNVGCDSSGNGYGGWGIYLDEGSSEVLVEKNLVYNCSSQGFHQHYGKDNIIKNNIFALNGEGAFRISRKEEHNSLTLSCNIFLGDDTPMYTDVVEGEFKDDNNLYWDYTRNGNVLSSYSTSNDDRINKLKMSNLGYYNNGVFKDPLFKDSANHDFTLALNSPAFDMGFEKWNYSDAGTFTLFK